MKPYRTHALAVILLGALFLDSNLALARPAPKAPPAPPAPPAVPAPPAPPSPLSPPSPPAPGGGWVRAGRPARTRDAQQRIPARGRAVALQSSSADVTVSVGTSETIEIDAHLEYWSNVEEWMEAVEREFKIEVEESSGQVRLRTVLPEFEGGGVVRGRRFGHVDISHALTVTLRVPKGTALGLDNDYGDVVVRGVGGALDLDNESGDVVVEGSTGQVVIDNRYGDVTASELATGPVRIGAQSGSVRLAKVGGGADVRSAYGDVRVDGVAGDLVLEAGSGQVEVRAVRGRLGVNTKYGDVEAVDVLGDVAVRSSSGNVKLSQVGAVEVVCSYGDVEVSDATRGVEIEGSSGNLTVRRTGGGVAVRGSYGDVVVETVKGDVVAKSASGSVTASDVTGRAELQSSYGSVRARRIGGAVRAVGTSAELLLEDIGGAIDADTSFGGVTVRGARGAVRARAQSGAIEIAGLGGAALAARHELQTTYGDVAVAWPRSAKLGFRLESSGGSVKSDLPGHESESGSRLVLESGTTAGGAQLTVTVQSGDVRLRVE